MFCIRDNQNYVLQYPCEVLIDTKSTYDPAYCSAIHTVDPISSNISPQSMSVSTFQLKLVGWMSR